MKFNIMVPVISLFLSLLACKDQNSSNADGADGQKPKYYPDISAAAKQAKSDLEAVLKSDPDIQLNIDATALQHAQEEGQLDVFSIDFDRLLTSDSADVLITAADAGFSYIPFVAGDSVIAVANIRKQDKGFSIGMLGNNKISKDLQQIRGITGTTAGIKIYEVPNINAIVYEARLNGNVSYFTDYKGIFTLKEPVHWERIASVLYKDAQAFQSTYGDLIKKEKLVK